MAGQILGFTFSLVAFIALICSASLLQQIRNILRDIRDTQRKVAAKMGVPTRDLEARAPTRVTRTTNNESRPYPARR